jgi:RNase P subunit RPR2
VDFLTKKRVKNEGIVPQYYVENNHEAIIPRELYLQVQEEMKRRSLLFKGKEGRRRIYSSKYSLSSITFCSDCGDIYRRTYWNNRGKKSTVWRCVTRLEEGPKGCTSRTISEEDLHSAVAEAFNQVLSGGESMIAILRENIETVVCESNEQTIANIDKEMEEKQMELISYANFGKDYENLADEIQALSDRKQAILTEEAESQGEQDRIIEMMEFIENNADKSLDYDEELVRLLVEKATIFENNVVVRFKSGIEIEIK